jgi:serine/threonine-protein kinase
MTQVLSLSRELSAAQRQRLLDHCTRLLEVEHRCLARLLAAKPISHDAIELSWQAAEGEPLPDRLSRGLFDLAQAVWIVECLTEGLDALHRAGLVHGDLCPEHVLVGAQVQLLDLGLSRLAAPGADHPERVAYRAPEVLGGGQPQTSSDLWSAGVILYRLLTGYPPFAGSTTAEVLENILHHEPPPLTPLAGYLPADLDHIVATTLHRDSRQRYPSASFLLADLRHIRLQLTPPALPPPRPVRPESEDRDSEATRRTRHGGFREALGGSRREIRLPRMRDLFLVPALFLVLLLLTLYWCRAPA